MRVRCAVSRVELNGSEYLSRANPCWETGNYGIDILVSVLPFPLQETGNGQLVMETGNSSGRLE